MMLTGPDTIALLSALAETGSPHATDIVGFALLSIVAVVAGTSDGLYHRIPNQITYPAIAAGFLFHGIAGLAMAGPTGLGAGMRGAGIGFCVAFLPFFAMYILGVIRGAADVKIMGAFGAFLAGWEPVLHAVFYGFLAAALVALGVIIAKGLFKKTLANMAMIATQVAGKTKPQVASVGPPIGLAVGLAVGAILAGLESFLHLVMPWGRL